MLSVEKTLKQEIEQWKHEYEVLDACCELAQGKIAELKAENERLKKLECKFKEYCTCNTEKYIQTLQEIKAIVCGNYEIIDPQGRKDILKLINKTEEE